MEIHRGDDPASTGERPRWLAPRPTVTDRGAGILFAVTLLAPSIQVTWGEGGVLYVAATGGLLLLGGASLHRGLAVKRPRATFVALCALWVGWMLFSAIWSTSGTQYSEDIILLLGILALVGLGGVVVSRAASRQFMGWLLLGSIVSAVWVLFGYWTAGSLRGYDITIAEYYLVTAQLIGMGVLIALSRALMGDRPLLWWPICVLLGLGLALSLARGALLLALLLSVGMGMVSRPSLGETGGRAGGRLLRSVGRVLQSRLLIGVMIGGFAWVALSTALSVERTAARMERLISGAEVTREVGSRDWLWATSWERILENPVLGSGLGSSGRVLGMPEGTYSHNLFLQVWVEGGIVGFLLLLGVVAYPATMALRHLKSGGRADPVFLTAFAMFLFLLGEHSKSTSIYSGRGLFLLGLVLVAVVPGRPLPGRSGESSGTGGSSWRIS